ncbi:MAG TPA: hypothetical protein VF835_06885 [Rhizomicrobium sp.]
MPPSFFLPAVVWSFGVKPMKAAKSRPERKRFASPIFAAITMAPTGPTDGMAASL